MEKSYWFESAKTDYPALKEDIETDVVVIGGGIAGTMAAYELTNRGFEVVLLEADKIGSGETGRSSAMISVAHDIIYDRLIKKHGEEQAEKYLALQEYGLKTIKEIIKSNLIDCGFMPADMLIYARTEKGFNQVLNEYCAYNKLGRTAEITNTTELPFKVVSALKIKEQGILNPYRFVCGLAGHLAKQGCRIYENTKVNKQPEGQVLTVGNHKVKAKNFIVATHYPYINFKGAFWLKMFQHRSHNVVFESDLKLKDIYECADDGGFEYRQAEGRILCGGANIRTGKYDYQSQYKIVEENIHKEFGASSRIVSRFSAQDCMTYDMLMYAGRIGDSDNLYVISGFNKWGFTQSVAAAKTVADLIEDKKFDNMFDTRGLKLLKAPINVLKNVGTIVGDFAELVLNTAAKSVERIKPGQGAVVKIGGRRLGVYRDHENKLHAVSAVCSHMGCALRWNKDELSWDCPCHGSRFDIEGNVLNNPALEKLEKVNLKKK